MMSSFRTAPICALPSKDVPGDFPTCKGPLKLSPLMHGECRHGFPLRRRGSDGGVRSGTAAWTGGLASGRARAVKEGDLARTLPHGLETAILSAFRLVDDSRTCRPWDSAQVVTGATGGAAGRLSVGPVRVEAQVELWRCAGRGDGGGLGRQAHRGEDAVDYARVSDEGVDVVSAGQAVVAPKVVRLPHRRPDVRCSPC